MYQDCEVEETMLKKIIKYFIELSEDKIVNGKKIVKFHVSSQNQFTEDEKIAYPNGNLDFGIAHGMAGPLALMSYAVQNGVVIDGQIDAIKKLIRLYDTHSFYEDQILRWPTILSFDNYWEKDVSVNRYDKKMGWCYGSIGISRVLYIASQCVELESLKYLDNLKKISQLPINKFNLVSPTLCHGYAGVLSILNLTYKENPKLVEMKKGIDSNLHQILKCYDPSLKYGFRNVEFYETGLIEDESNTYLSGTTGIVLTLLSLLQSDSRHEEHLMIK